MVSPLRSSSPQVVNADMTVSLAQAWLQNALNALYYGADTAQATAMLRKAETYLNKAASINGSAPFEASPRSSRMHYGVKTGRGSRHQARPNEDNFFAICGMLPPPLNLPFGFFVVTDGMGGHANGQMASSMVIQQLTDLVLPRLLAGETNIDSLLVEGIQSAHEAILQRNNQQSAEKTMGSLVTAALIIGATATIANVGDSRTYLYRPSVGLQQITEDHSVVASMVSAGVIRPEDIYTHPKRNQVYRALGAISDPLVEVDLFTLTLEKSDKLLLCSDGLWEMVRDPEIEYLMRADEEPVATAHKLYMAALRGGGQDNIGVVVVEYGVSSENTEALSFVPLQEQNTAPLSDENDGDGGRPATTYMPAVPARWWR
jgi:serine/threonine protein phosphatase PrpC